MAEAENEAKCWRCQVLDFDQPYEVYDDQGLCLYHSENEGKEKDFPEVKELLERGIQDFRGFVFPKDFNFRKAEFKEKADFSRAKFEGEACFSEAEFEGVADFRDAQFKGEANFHEAKFKEYACFSDAQFEGVADFYEAQFKGGAYFFNAQFEGEAYFLYAEFKGVADFIAAEFKEEADFSRAKFKGEAKFGSAGFKEEANFRKAEFEGEVNFGRAEFKEEADFSEAEFEGEANFCRAEFEEEAYFYTTTFHDADFSFAIFKGETVFSRARFKAAADFRGGVDKEEDDQEDDQEKEYELFSREDDTLFLRVMFEKPELVYFYRVNLSRCRFLDTDLKSVNFIGITDWHQEGWRAALYDEINDDSSKSYPELMELYRQLKQNYEERRNWEVAGHFHFGQMMMQLRQKWQEGKIAASLILQVYRILGGYGVRYGRIMLWILGMIVGFGLLYSFKGSVNFGEAMLHSLGYMTFRGIIADQGIDKLFPWPIAIQSLFGPVLVALLILALRRRFKF